MKKPANKKLAFNYNRVENISTLIRKVMAPNPSPFTLYGTGTFIVGKN